mgnify:CR=1 FL=1
MAQIKKAEVRDRIFFAAYRLFKDKGYQKVQMADIAREARITPSNIYTYYHSKFDLFYEVYGPTVISRLNQIKRDVSDISSPRDKLRHILKTLWGEMPHDQDKFARNLMEALATVSDTVEKPRYLLNWCEEFVWALLKGCLPEERQSFVRDSSLAYLVWMIFDGFSLNAGKGDVRDLDRIIDVFTDLLLGEPSRENLPPVPEMKKPVKGRRKHNTAS